MRAFRASRSAGPGSGGTRAQAWRVSNDQLPSQVARGCSYSTSITGKIMTTPKLGTYVLAAPRGGRELPPGRPGAALMAQASWNRIEKSIALTSLVRAPTEMRSTPVSARARKPSSVTPPEISSAARASPAASLRRTASRNVDEVHVVQQHHARAVGQRLVELGQRLDLDLDEAGPCRDARRGTQRRAHAARRDDVVLLDQHRVVEADAVVGAAARPHRVLLREPQAGQRLAGVDDSGPGAAHGIDMRRGPGRHRAEQLQEVERGALGSQQRPGSRRVRAPPGPARSGAFLDLPADPRLGVELPHHRLDPGRTAQHSAFARQHPGHRTAIGGNQRGGEVAAAHVFIEGPLCIGAHDGGPVGGRKIESTVHLHHRKREAVHMQRMGAIVAAMPTPAGRRKCTQA